ncbi:MAG: hypothetical protein AAB833_00765 [Patescibacteria group bacterium]
MLNEIFYGFNGEWLAVVGIIFIFSFMSKTRAIPLGNSLLSLIVILGIWQVINTEGRLNMVLMFGCYLIWGITVLYKLFYDKRGKRLIKYRTQFKRHFEERFIIVLIGVMIGYYGLSIPKENLEFFDWWWLVASLATVVGLVRFYVGRGAEAGIGFGVFWLGLVGIIGLKSTESNYLQMIILVIGLIHWWLLWNAICHYQLNYDSVNPEIEIDR